ncbi:hypothetical protein Tco_0888873 [Tanacetum coccineum]
MANPSTLGTDIKEMDIIKAKMDKAKHEKERVYKRREFVSKRSIKHTAPKSWDCHASNPCAHIPILWAMLEITMIEDERADQKERPRL